MRRTKTMLMGDLLEEFFKRPYIAAKVAEGKLPDTWREIVGDRAAEVTTELRLENHILHVRTSRAYCDRNFSTSAKRSGRRSTAVRGSRLVNAVIIR